MRSTKYHLHRVASDGSLTFDEAATLLIQIEAILNSRPLTPLSSDPEDYSYLTPGHFLIGDSLISYPESNLQHLPMNRLSRWQRIEQIHQQFWKRWSVDYLHQMQQRTKWKQGEGPSIQPGQMVVVRENDSPPQSWIIGRIVAVLQEPMRSSEQPASERLKGSSNEQPQKFAYYQLKPKVLCYWSLFCFVLFLTFCL